MMVIPSLVVKIGLNEALFFWVDGNLHEGRNLTYNTY